MAASSIIPSFFLQSVLSLKIEFSADQGKGFVDFLQEEFPHVDFGNEHLRIELRVAFALGSCFIGWEHTIGRFGHVDGEHVVFIEQFNRLGYEFG